MATSVDHSMLRRACSAERQRVSPMRPAASRAAWKVLMPLTFSVAMATTITTMIASAMKAFSWRRGCESGTVDTRKKSRLSFCCRRKRREDSSNSVSPACSTMSPIRCATASPFRCTATTTASYRERKRPSRMLLPTIGFSGLTTASARNRMCRGADIFAI